MEYISDGIPTSDRRVQAENRIIQDRLTMMEGDDKAPLNCF